MRVRFDSFDAQSEFKRTMGESPPGCPCWSMAICGGNTLAIAEYAVLKPGLTGSCGQPTAKARARARSVCAEMHSGFHRLRSHCPMNIEALLPDTGSYPRPARRTRRRRAAPGGDVGALPGAMALRCGQFTVADAYFAPGVHAPAHLRPAHAAPHRRIRRTARARTAAGVKA